MISLRILIACLLLAVTIPVCSQNFELPAGYSFSKKEDYALYEKDIVAASKWLLVTPVNEETVKWKSTAKFVAEWVMGSPTVSVELNQVIFDMEQKNPGIMVLFMAGCSLYVLENNYSADMKAKHKSAFTALALYYKKGNGLKKDKKLEKLVKAYDSDTIIQWIDENLPIQK